MPGHDDQPTREQLQQWEQQLLQRAQQLEQILLSFSQFRAWFGL